MKIAHSKPQGIEANGMLEYFFGTGASFDIV